MAAADQQWENEIQSRSRSVGPQTPPAKNHDPTQLEFQVYISPRAKSAKDKVEMVDDEVRAKLAGKITKVDNAENHLYVFSSPKVKGVYRVGRGHHVSRPTKEYERRYPEHVLHCYIECPNANLFESVVHAEFLLSRRTHYCYNCETTHKEWVEAPLHDILDSVTAWSLYARWLYRCGIDIDKQQQIMLMAKSSDRADRWRNWALKETMRWMDNPRGCMPPISREFRETSTAPECDCESTTKNEYFSDSAPGLSDSPGTTPGSEGIRDPPTPPTSPTPTPVGRGLVINKHTRKQTNALRAPEEEASWEDATTKPTARALFINHDQRPSGKRRTLLRAEDPAFHVSLTEGRSKNNEDQHKESSLEEKDSIQGILSAGIDKKVREVLARVVTEIQVTNAGSLKASGTIYLLSLESAKGFYRICCWSGNKVLSPEKGCYDKATPFHDIPNYMAVKKLLLAEFGVPPPDRKCERCSKTHRDWTKVSDQDVNVNTSREESVNVRCLDVHDHNCELSKGPDRWRCGRDKVVEMQKDETAVEDVPTNIPPSKTPVAVDLEPRSTPEGRTNGRFGGLGGMMGKPTVSTEQQAPGLLDIGIATVRNIFNGLF